MTARLVNGLILGLFVFGLAAFWLLLVPAIWRTAVGDPS